MHFVNIDGHIGIDGLIRFRFSKAHGVSFLEVGGTKATRLAYFNSYRTRKHCRPTMAAGSNVFFGWFFVGCTTTAHTPPDTHNFGCVTFAERINSNVVYEVILRAPEIPPNQKFNKMEFRISNMALNRFAVSTSAVFSYTLKHKHRRPEKVITITL